MYLHESSDTRHLLFSCKPCSGIHQRVGTISIAVSNILLLSPHNHEEAVKQSSERGIKKPLGERGEGALLN